jgi:hypothetical protein
MALGSLLSSDIVVVLRIGEGCEVLGCLMVIDINVKKDHMIDKQISIAGSMKWSVVV